MGEEKERQASVPGQSWGFGNPSGSRVKAGLARGVTTGIEKPDLGALKADAATKDPSERGAAIVRALAKFQYAGIARANAQARAGATEGSPSKRDSAAPASTSAAATELSQSREEPRTSLPGTSRSVDRGIASTASESGAYSRFKPRPQLRAQSSRSRTTPPDGESAERKTVGELKKLSLEREAPSAVPPAEPDEEALHQFPGGKFSCRASRSGHILDFYLDGGAHYRWTGHGYRLFNDARGCFDSRSSDIEYPLATLDKERSCVVVRFGSGRKFHFFTDGRFEERTLEGDVIQEWDGAGQLRNFFYDADGAPYAVGIKFEGAPAVAYFLMEPGRRQVALAALAGYQFKNDRTGHVEVMTRTEAGWQLALGDRIHWFPSEANVSLDRWGNRRVASGNRVYFQGHSNGSCVIRNQLGHVVELASPYGDITLLARSPAGGVEQIMIFNGQAQLVEHATAYNGVWDSPDIAKIYADDATGAYTIAFTGGQEVIRKLDGTQELKGATADYRLDADRIVAGLADPFPAEQLGQLLADLASISRLDADTQSWIYSAVWEISHSDGCPTRLTTSERIELVASMVHQIAHPESIMQGHKDAAVAATAEKVLAMRRPYLYADCVAKLASQGEFTVATGARLKAQRKLDGSLADYSDSSHSRSAASELLQTALMQLAMPEGCAYRSYPSGHEPVPAEIDRSTDTGERIIVGRFEEKFTGLRRDALVSVLNDLMPEEKWVSVPVLSPDDLVSAWRSIGNQAPLPVTTKVEIPDPRSGSVPASHAVLITHVEFDAAGNPGRVYFENTADNNDHGCPGGRGVPLETFFASMRVRQSSSLAGTETVVPIYAIVRTCQ